MQRKPKERKQFFYLPRWANKLIESFRTPVNKVGFILQLGYFKATNSFFAARYYHQGDINFIADRLDIFHQSINISNYNRTTFERHQEHILENMGIKKFDNKSKVVLTNEARNFCAKQTKPRLMVMSIIDFYVKKRLTFPVTNFCWYYYPDHTRVWKSSYCLHWRKFIHGGKQLLDSKIVVCQTYHRSKSKFLLPCRLYPWKLYQFVNL